MEELFAENTGESEGDIAEEDIRRSVVGVALVQDVGEEGVCRVKGLPARLACPLGRGVSLRPVQDQTKISFCEVSRTVVTPITLR